MAPRYSTLPEITPSELKTFLEVLDQMDNPPALMVYGPPGVGKTTILKEFAEKKKYELRVLHLSRMDPSDWSGIPRQNRNYTEFLPISLFKPPRKRGKKPVKIVVFFDELNTAMPQVLNAALDVLLEKRSDHANAKLPDDTIIVAAGNLGEEDGTYVEHLSSAVRTRLIQVRLRVDVREWLDWARQNNIHPAVIEFISTHANGLYPLLDMEGLRQDHDQVATPRGWERVSQLLKAWEKCNGNLRRDYVLEKMVVGTVGERIGRGFMEFLRKRINTRDTESVIRRLKDLAGKIGMGEPNSIVKFIEFVDFFMNNRGIDNLPENVEKAIIDCLHNMKGIYQQEKQNLLIRIRSVRKTSGFLNWLNKVIEEGRVKDKSLAAFLSRIKKELENSR